jgi:hypothetical protein
MATGFDTEFTTSGRTTVARYDRYEEAQRAVDHVSIAQTA